MKHKPGKLLPALLAAVLCLSLLSGCTFMIGPSDTPFDDDLSDDWDDSDWLDDSTQGGDLSAIGRDVKYVGDFTTQDLNGNAVTPDIFRQNKLTMVNVFATWCSPCVAEMPDLEKLYQQMKDRDVGVVGVVLDVLNEKGEIVDEDLERAQLLVKRTGVTYPVLLPDSTYFNGRLMGIDAIPETFFVDQNGNIVGESYCGSGSLEDWLEVVKTELAKLKETQ